MLAGEQGTGKTTIARYLVGKQPTRTRMSTDGIELYNGLAYMDREENDWLSGSQGNTFIQLKSKKMLHVSH